MRPPTTFDNISHGEGWPVGTIAAQLGLHHETVERALAEQVRAEAVPRPSEIDPYMEFARETLSRYPQLRSTRLW